jgi:DNA-binding transcriptional LysR family regulator
MDLDDLDAFLAVVRVGSVAGAAESLGVPRSTLRRRLDELEARVGVPLLLRSPVGVQLSPAGEVLAHRGRLLGEQYNALLDAAREEGETVQGLIRLVVPAELPGELVAPLLEHLSLRHPALRLEILIREEPLISVPREAHVAVWVGAEPPPGPWASAAFATLDEGAWARPDWIVANPQPTDPTRLRGRAAWLVGNVWPLRAGGFVEPGPVICSQDATLVASVGRSGGVVWLPSAVARRFGLTAAVLPRQLGRVRSLWVVAPQSLASVVRVREVLEAAPALQR